MAPTFVVIQWRRAWRRLALLGAVILVPGCGSAPAPEIRIGVLANLTGPMYEPSGRATVEMAELVADDANRAGGIVVDGRPHHVRLVVKDIGDQAERVTAMVRELINRDSVVAIVGPQFSRAAIPVANIAEAARIPMISPMSSNPATTSGKRFVFRIAFVDLVQGAVLARFARDSLGATRAALLFDVADAYNRGLADAFAAAFEARGGTVVAAETYTTDAAGSFDAQLERIRVSRPEVLLLPNDVGTVERQIVAARRAGISAVLLGTDLWDAVRLGRVPEAEGAYMTHQWHPAMADSAGREVLARFATRFGHPAGGTEANTYDAVTLLLQAIRSAGSTDPVAIRDGLAAVRDHVGLSGRISYRRGGDPERPAALIRIIGGRAVLVGPMDP